MKCDKCGKKFEEIWQFGPWERFQKYIGKEYCKECFEKLVETLGGKK